MTASTPTSDVRTAQLAAFIAGARLQDMDPEARRLAVPAIVDSVAVMLAGRRAQAGAVILEYAARSASTRGGCWTAGTADGLPAETAALANGTLAHALDYDDALPGAGHPSGLLLAAIVATAESNGVQLTGEKLVEAFVLGFEVVAKMAKTIGVAHYYKGWHTMSTAGSFGTAAAAAHILGLGEPEIRVALGTAGSLASGIQRNFGTATKPLHAGLAARNGVLAATLASLGFTASDNVLDGGRGFLDLYSVDGQHPEELDTLGQPWSLVQPGPALNKYPCCYATARPIDGMLSLRHEHALTADLIDRVEIAVPKGGLQALLYSRPTTGLGGKFSMEYVIAAALVDGHVRLDSFTDEAVNRPVIRELLERIGVVEERDLRPEDPDCLTSSPATGGRVEVRVRLKDGQNHVVSVEEPHGGPRNPLSWDDIWLKFEACAEFGGYPAVSAKTAFDTLKDLEHQDDVVAILRTLTASIG